ncbi:MAG: hypothetical protein AAF081_09820 [Actinomycetota bacterium]
MSSLSSGRRWYERVVVAAMVIVGFGAGSVGLSLLADVRDDHDHAADHDPARRSWTGCVSDGFALATRR